MIERIDSLYDLSSIQKEVDTVVAGLATSQKALTDLYNTVKSYKGSDITNLTTNTEKLSVAMDEASTSSAKVVQSNRALVESAKAQSTAILGGADSYAYFASSVQEVIRQQLKLKTQLEIIKDQVKENAAAFNSGKKSYDEYKNTQIALEESTRRLKLESRDLEKSINIQIKANNSVGGSLDDLRNQYNQLYDVFRKLTDAERDSDLGKQMAADLGTLKSNINEVQKSAGDFSANVGRYAGSFAGAFDVLVSELQQVREKIATLGAGSADLKKLEKEEKLLTQLTENLTQAFKNPTQELRAFTNAAKSLGQEFGVASDKFQNFAKEVGDKKDELEDIQGTINFQASDTKYLDGIVSAVNGLAGAYGAAQSAAVLLGDDNEAMQKTMVKLQAILTLVTSLQAVQNAVQTDGAAVQTLLAAKTALLTAAKKAQAYFAAQTVVSAQAEVAANAELAVAQGAVAAAAGAQATATEATVAANTQAAISASVTTTAMEGEALAATEATVATKGLSTALVATGIGAAILAIVAGIVYLISKVSDWAAADEKAIKKQDELTEATQRLNKVIADQAQFIKQRNQASVDFAEKELNLSKAKGENTLKQFALEKALTAEQKKQADAVVKKFGATEEGVNRATHAYADALTQSKYFADQERKAIDKGEEDWVDYYKVRRESAEKSVSAAKESLDNISGALKDQTDIANRQQVLQTQEATFNEEERRKIALESTKINSALIIDANERILSNEKSTQEARIKALKSNAAEQKKIAQAENAAVQNNPGSNQSDKILAAQNLSSEVVKIEREKNEKIEAVNQDYLNRNIAATLSANEKVVQANNAIQEELIKSDNLSAEQRIQAAEKLFNNQKGLLEKAYEEEKRQAALTGKTGDEKLLIEAEYNAKLAELNYSTQKGITDIIKSELDKREKVQDEYFATVERSARFIDTGAAERYAVETVALTKQLRERQITYQEYTRAKEKLDTDYALSVSRTALQTSQTELQQLEARYGNIEEIIKSSEEEIRKVKLEAENATSEATKQAILKRLDLLIQEYDIEKKNADKILALRKEIADKSVEITTKTTETNQKLSEQSFDDLLTAAQTFQTLSNNIFQAFGEIASIGIDKQKVAVEELENAQQKNYENEIKRINASTLSDEQKADKLKILESQRQAQKEENDRKTRELEVRRAKFERAANIASIITSTAVAVVGALAQVKTLGPVAGVLAATYGVLGAAQLARAIATPLPKYEKGTDHAKAGWALTDEKGAELYIEPSGKTYMGSDNGPTLRQLTGGTKIIPADDVNTFLHGMMMKKTASVINNISNYKEPDTSDKIIEAVNIQTQLTLREMRKQKKGVTVNIKNESGYLEYRKKQTFN